MLLWLALRYIDEALQGRVLSWGTSDSQALFTRICQPIVSRIVPLNYPWHG